VSLVLLVIGVSIEFCHVIAILAGDPAAARLGLLLSAAIVTCAGAALFWFTRGRVDLSRRDGFGIVTFGWLAASLAGALPFVMSGTIPSFVSAVFETMSGFTTTGASVLSDLELVPRGVLFWRALTHFYGGMGVLVLCIAIIPLLGTGGMQIYRAEIPGPSKERLTPRIATTAKLLWGVYVLLCLAEAVLLRLGGLSWFDAFCHTFATMATGGFSTRSASVGAYNSAYVETVIIVFMFLAGANFALHFRALRGAPLCYFRDVEFRFYFFVWLSACVFLTLNIWGRAIASFPDALRAGFFQGTSILTTTGFCTADFDLWPGASKVMLVLLMFVGGCAGSTGGGMKNVRVFVILKTMVRELRAFMRPQAVFKIKIGKSPLNQSVVSHITGFVIAFLLTFVVATLLMTFYTRDLATAASSAIATLGNIGPGLGGVGATQTYAHIPAPGKLILTACMLLGRLELYTVLILFLPSFWHR
jgi:trk system potassium uptake protein TrkH